MLEWVQTTEGVIGTEGVGKCNRNGLLLLKKYTEHELLITNTVFRLPTRNKTSWMHPRTKEGQTGCQTTKDYVWCRLLDRSQAYCQQTQPAHSASTATTRQEGAKETGYLQAETRQQEASLHQ